MRELIRESPDIREDMVADLRNRIFGGVYKVRAEKIADRIMQHGTYILNPLRRRDRYPPKAPEYGHFS